MKTNFLIWISSWLLTSIALASPLAYISGPVTYSGSGCPANSTSLTLSPDETSLSALFGSFETSFAAGATRAKLNHCTIRVPIQVSSGYRLTITSAEYRGAATFAKKAWGYFRAFHSVHDKYGPHYSGSFVKVLKGGTDEVFTYSTNKKARSLACGGKMELRFYSETYLLHYSRNEASDFTLDSLDFSLLSPGDHIRLEPCH